ncbi:EmrB/QacA family drug resistance transporter [Lactobacillus sp.] [Lactiplantibacillus mudanjiangensis]|uniref:DHA2 family efflux MFS transporter permease subunit n=1 Tax=Lactiplantibacillus mudanjiangensis TaxID=1296538 RepID=UPI0010146A2E|nr:DHA2 family efflux MFS transporter permease subunit [Lactiplantibacillus mudanjiangensis]VDG21327.1 EmrB/QacA family drug resistance transporter [Lactobacillus sp.] [Lactiplantibacillus mudanjiangensis]VDG32160.1 EmrB/QacA family drug resistance transporter [Lactobacillus sp.] [Lactiplantibacillus mudanjiangensis]
MQTKSHTNPTLIMIGLLLGGFVGMFSETALNIALPQLEQQLNVNTGTIQWLVTGYLLMVGIVLPLSSMLTKHFTTRQLIIFALIDFMVGAIISALAGSFLVLLIGRMIQGIATGLILPLIFIVLLAVYPPQKRGAAMGLVGLVIMFAPAVGPTLAGLILGLLSWHWIFWLFVPLLAIALIITIIFMQNVAEVTKPKVDALSIVLSSFGFGGLVVGASLAGDRGWGNPLVLGALIIGLVALYFYGYRQLHLETPILNLRAFSFRNFSIGTVLVMIDFGIIMSSMYLLPMYWQKGLVVPVALTGVLMLPGGVINAVVSATSGRLFDNYGAKYLTRIGFGLSFIGALMLIFTTTHSGYWYVVLAHVIIMIGAPLAMSPAQTYGLNALRGPVAADGSTILNTLQQILGALATAIATSLLGIGQSASNATGATAFVHGVHYGFWFTLALAVLGSCLSFMVDGKPAKSVDPLVEKQSAATAH